MTIPPGAQPKAEAGALDQLTALPGERAAANGAGALAMAVALAEAPAAIAACGDGGVEISPSTC